MNQIVDGLFSVLVTLGVVPIIRCPKGGAAEHVAAALETRLRDHLKARSNLFSEGTSALAATLSRPLLVIFDRNFDLSVMLQHCWSYKPLVQVSSTLVPQEQQHAARQSRPCHSSAVADKQQAAEQCQAATGASAGHPTAYGIQHVQHECNAPHNLKQQSLFPYSLVSASAPQLPRQHT